MNGRKANLSLAGGIGAQISNFLNQTLEDIPSNEFAYGFSRWGPVKVGSQSLLHCIAACLLYDKQQSDKKNIANEKTNNELQKSIANEIKYNDQVCNFISRKINNNSKSFIRIIDTAKQLVHEYINTTRQETFGMKDKDIINSFKSYVDPRLFASLLEHIFNVNLIMFVRLNTQDGGEFLLPRNKGGFLKYKNSYRERKTLLIYCHKGGDDVVQDYELHSEVILYKHSPFIPFHIINTISNYYHKTLNPLPFGKINELQKFPLNIQIKHQWVDKNGKTRIIITSDDIIIKCSPIPPFIAPLIDYKYITANTSSQKINTFMEKHKFNNNKYESDGVKLEIVHFPSNNIDTLTIEQLKKIIECIKNKGSLISHETWNSNYRAARIILEAYKWLFSKYLHEESKLQRDKYEDIRSVALKFVRNKTTRNLDFRYNLFRKKFSDNNFISSDGKIILNSPRIKYEDIAYQLLIEFVRNKESLLSYRDEEGIRKFYDNVSDFKKSENAIIFNGKQALLRWINRKVYSKKYYTSIPRDIPLFYFKYSDFSDELLLLQRTTSLSLAIKVGETWIEKGYNIYLDEKKLYEGDEEGDEIDFEGQNKMYLIREEDIGIREGNRGVSIVRKQEGEVIYYYSVLKKKV
jgi:hypothetical protein